MTHTLTPHFKKENGLIPVIIQDTKTQNILMLGYMNQQSYDLTRETNYVHFYSRSRQTIWKKGETSGNTLHVEKILIDCDADTLLIQVSLEGDAACHTGKYSCFYRSL